VKKAPANDLFRLIPSVDDLIRGPEIADLAQADGQPAVLTALRTVLDKVRAEISRGTLDEAGVQLALSGVGDAVRRELRAQLDYSLRPVINATGVILHTNLGRAPLSPAALEHARQASVSYSNLEYDLETGERGKRDVHVDRLFQRLLNEAGGSTALASTVVVNNNAAAVLLALNTLADGGEVIVSRGELVEIGGSFRIPDVMTKSGAVLREVGTTNRTRIADYENAINDRTRLLLRVHRSNFEITGFTESPAIEELAELSQRRGIPVMEDLGSGALVELSGFGVPGEPNVLDSLRKGMDVVSYSGDKLLGGPQAGLLSGKTNLIGRMRSNSLFRALRVDKLIYAALEATLLSYVRHDYNSVPALRMMRTTASEIEARARTLAEKIASPGIQTEIMDGQSLLGGGAAPSSTLPTKLLTIECRGLRADELASQLRLASLPVIVRVEDGRVLIDLRTVFSEQDAAIAQTLVNIAKRKP
jgi:L-seryl-tRNA(Ser) seleniumtransferase